MRLVKAAVDQLLADNQPVTIEAICQKSIEVDQEHRGVKKSAVLDNPEAHAYYQEHSLSYRRYQARKRKPRGNQVQPQPLRIEVNRDLARARQRYLHFTKSDLVDRLIAVEQAYAELLERQTRLQFEWIEMQQQAGQLTSQRARKRSPGKKP